MSFALEYRQKMQAEARRALAEARARAEAHTGFVVLPAAPDDDTRANRRRVLAALSLAGIILSVFNSGSMVQYAGGLAASSLGKRIIVATESWHGLMEQSHLTAVVREIRHAVSGARAATWPDLAVGRAQEATRPREALPVAKQPPRLEPQSTQPAPSYLPHQEQPVRVEPPIEPERPRGAVMRAAVER